MKLTKGEKLNIEKYPLIKFHNEYFGAGMSSIVFQEMRESKALAYSVYSAYRIPNKAEDHHYVMSYIGTQADKLDEAMSGMTELLDFMPEAETNMNNAKDAIIQKIRTERLTKMRILTEYEKAKRMGIDYDIRKDLFSQVRTFDMSSLISFHQDHIANKTRVVLVLGPKEDIDMDVLEQYGNIEHLTLGDVFGY